MLLLQLGGLEPGGSVVLGACRLPVPHARTKGPNPVPSNHQPGRFPEYLQLPRPPPACPSKFLTQLALSDPGATTKNEPQRGSQKVDPPWASEFQEKQPAKKNKHKPPSTNSSTAPRKARQMRGPTHRSGHRCILRMDENQFAPAFSNPGMMIPR